MSDVKNPIIGYADTYRAMSRQGAQTVDIWSVITDLERNMAPLMGAALSEVSALREELADYRRRVTNVNSQLAAASFELSETREAYLNQTCRLTAAEQRNAELVDLLGELTPYETYMAATLFQRILAALKPTESVSDVCTSCDGSGEYIDAIGDWRGYCSCPAGVELKNKPTESGASE